MRQFPGSYTVDSLLRADAHELLELRALLDPELGKVRDGG